MRDVYYLERLEQAEALLKPIRVEILRRLGEPHSCTEIAADLGQTSQKVYYHVKRLQEAGVVEQTDERRVRGIVEGIYQAVARSYWLSPRLIGAVGGRRVRDELSLGHLAGLTEQLTEELGQLSTRSGEVPSLGITGEVRLRVDDRPAFLRDLRAAIQDVLSRYGGSEGDAYRIAMVSYPLVSPVKENDQ